MQLIPCCKYGGGKFPLSHFKVFATGILPTSPNALHCPWLTFLSDLIFPSSSPCPDFATVFQLSPSLTPLKAVFP